MNDLTFVILRLAAGASMFGHGLVRLPKLNSFSQWMVGTFEKSMLPKAMVTPFSYLLPIAEFIIGILLLSGLFTKPALIGGSLAMILLIFGSCLIENWEILPSQLIHAAFFAVLLQFSANNTYSLDNLFFNK
ncbi:DoxX family protein [Mucilaginibacter sp. R-33]|uniref:DoxX family protein n=1 Tax=Mucilaginibacter sp. R-33 TaxID=3416711 RepID=UPI003CE6DF3B